MKTLDFFRRYIPVMTISSILIASAFVAGAEDHHKKESRENENDRNRLEYRKPDRQYENRPGGAVPDSPRVHEICQKDDRVMIDLNCHDNIRK